MPEPKSDIDHGPLPLGEPDTVDTQDSFTVEPKEAAEFAEDRIFSAEEMLIVQRAQYLEDEMVNRLMYGGRRQAYERLLDEALERAHFSREQWQAMRRLVMIPADQLQEEQEVRIRNVVDTIVVGIEQDVARGMHGFTYIGDALKRYAYYRAEVDFRERRSLEKQHEKEAAEDGLTGFVRHPSYAEKLYEVERRRLAELPENRCMMLVVIDLDDFKLENESHPRGHVGVDQDIILPIARNLESVLRAVDIKGRPGGDELFLMINDIDLSADSLDPEAAEAIVSNDDGKVPAQAKRILAKIQKAIESVLRTNGKPMTGSIGFKIIRHGEASHGPTYQQATAEADRGSHHSKSLLARNRETSNITEAKDDLPEVSKDFEYYRHQSKKALGRVFPTEDLTQIFPYIDAMSNVLAQRQLENVVPENMLASEIEIFLPLFRELFKSASPNQVELSVKAILTIMTGSPEVRSINVSLEE